MKPDGMPYKKSYRLLDGLLFAIVLKLTLFFSLLFHVGHESAILKAMSGFQLPPESIPAWAQNIPEDQWRQQVIWIANSIRQ